MIERIAGGWRYRVVAAAAAAVGRVVEAVDIVALLPVLTASVARSRRGDSLSTSGDVFEENSNMTTSALAIDLLKKKKQQDSFRTFCGSSQDDSAPLPSSLDRSNAANEHSSSRRNNIGWRWSIDVLRPSSLVQRSEANIEHRNEIEYLQHLKTFFFLIKTEIPSSDLRRTIVADPLCVHK